MVDEVDVEKIIEMAQSSQASVARRLTTSAMTPMIFLCLINVPSCFAIACFFENDPYIKYPMVALGAVTILVASAMYVYFGICKPSRLQSEDFQIRQETLQMISKKGGRIVIEPVSLEAIVLPTPDEDDEASGGKAKK